MAAKFATTNWSVIARAEAPATAVRQNALAELCHAYWYPLYSFARGHGGNHEDACDLTQAFFVHLIEKHALGGLAPSQGRFRAFLLASFKNFQSDLRDRAHTLKRGGGWAQVSWDAELLESRYGATARAGEDPEQLFDRQWALTVIDRARERLRLQYAESDGAREFEVLWPYLAPDGRNTTDALAKALDATPGAARVALHRFRRRFGSALRAEVAATVADPGQVASELRFLLGVLAGRSESGSPSSNPRPTGKLTNRRTAPARR
jgi:RNA polymerase sigma-70 factor (ECF subfamily)